MICLGLDDETKEARVRSYCSTHPIRKVLVISPSRYRRDMDVGADLEHIEWAEVIQYKYFYRLLREIDADTLVVINECLRTQDRNCLTYNCMRHYLAQTQHQVVFQHLPIIDFVDDWMILFDFATRSRWKRDKWRPDLRGECEIEVRPIDIHLCAVDVPTDVKMRAAYEREKRRLIDGIGLRDPHTIPRNLHLMSGRAKLTHVDPGGQYVGRNNRFKLANLRTYREQSYPPQSTVFEFCHDPIRFADFLALSRQSSMDVLVADLRVDRWYFDRYRQWAGRMRDAYAALQ